jgi:Leucine-rich repeat (LRR) protein
LHNLTKLNLSYCLSLQDISSLATLHKLTQLDLSDCEGLSRTKIAKLQEKLPNCSIYG